MNDMDLHLGSDGLPIDLPHQFDQNCADEQRAGCNAFLLIIGAAGVFTGGMLAAWVLI